MYINSNLRIWIINYAKFIKFVISLSQLWAGNHKYILVPAQPSKKSQKLLSINQFDRNNITQYQSDKLLLYRHKRKKTRVFPSFVKDLSLIIITRDSIILNYHPSFIIQHISQFPLQVPSLMLILFKIFNHLIYNLSWIFLRFVISSIVYLCIFFEPGFTDQICGPLAIPVRQYLLPKVIFVQFAYFICSAAQTFVKQKQNSKYMKFLVSNSVKNLILFFFRSAIIFSQGHRIRYYITIIFLESSLFLPTLALDIINHPKMSQAWQIIYTDSLQRIVVFYEITRTFCPNFALFFLVTNLLFLIFSQTSMHILSKTQPKVDLPKYKYSFYTKQDIHRIAIMTFVYFGFFSILQSSTFGFGMVMAFAVSSVPFYKSIKAIHESKFGEALGLLVIVCMSIGTLLLLRISRPQIFKPILPKFGVCGIFDKQ